jgi:hypothetical protein
MPYLTGFGTLAVTLTRNTVNYGKRAHFFFMSDLQICNNTDVKRAFAPPNCNINDRLIIQLMTFLT